MMIASIGSSELDLKFVSIFIYLFFLVAVVVSKNMRGKGLGRILMDESEKHAKL